MSGFVVVTAANTFCSSSENSIRKILQVRRFLCIMIFVFVCLFVCLFVYIVLSQWEFIPWKIRVAFLKESQLQQKSRYPTPN